jgi:hypothetical protein
MRLKYKRTAGMAEVLDHLPRKDEILISNPRLLKQEEKRL